MSLNKEKRVVLKAGWSESAARGYPLVFARYIKSLGLNCSPGDIVDITQEGLGFVGRGYYNPKSEIAVRILTFCDEPVNEEFFTQRVAQAFLKRKPLLAGTNAVRAVFSEADSLPGLVVDVYNDTAVFQALTLGIERQKELCVAAIKKALPVKYIYERSDASVREIEGLPSVKRWWGLPRVVPVPIDEGKIKFLVDIENGHKTGFYLDQRKARRGVAEFCRDKRVLDLFSYCGGFAISAAVAQARAVTAVDIKSDWLELGRKNAALNAVSDKIDFVKGDVFDYLRRQAVNGEKFDLVVLDPPSFLKNRHALPDAIRGYRELNLSAMKILNDGGVLATFSCSHNMPNEIFSQVIKEAARSSGKTITIVKRCRQDIDHPIVACIPETNYLKGYFLKIETA